MASSRGCWAGALLKSQLDDRASEYLKHQVRLKDALAESQRSELALRAELQSAGAIEFDLQERLQGALTEEAQLRSHLLSATCRETEFQKNLDDSLAEEAQLRCDLQQVMSSESQLQEKLHDSLSEGAQLRSDLQHAASKESELEGKLQDSSCEEARLKVQLDVSLAEEAQLRYHLQQVMASESQLHGKLNNSLSEGAQLRSDLQHAASKESELEEKLQDSTFEEARLRVQLDESLSEGRELRAGLQRAANVHLKLRADLQAATLQNQLQDLRLNEEELRDSIAASQGRIQVMQLQRNTLETDEARLAAESRSAQDHYRKEETKFKRQQSARRSELVETERSCEALVERIHQLEQDELDLATQTAQRVALHGVHSRAAEDKAASLNLTLLNTESHCQQLNDQLDASVAEAERLTDRCCDAAVEVERKRVELAKLSVESADFERKIQATVRVEQTNKSRLDAPGELPDQSTFLSQMQLCNAVLQQAADLAGKRYQEISRENTISLTSRENSFSDSHGFEISQVKLARDVGKVHGDDDDNVESSQNDIEFDDRSENTDDVLDDTEGETPDAHSKFILPSHLSVQSEASNALTPHRGSLERISVCSALKRSGAVSGYESEKCSPMSIAQARHDYTTAEAKSGQESLESMRAAGILAHHLAETREYSDEAESLFRSVYTGFAVKLGEDNVETLQAANSLAVHLDNANKVQEAITFYRRAAIGRRSDLGADHPHTLDSSYNLAQALASCRQFSEAEATFREVFAGCSKTFGPDHHGTMDCLEKLVELLHETESKAADREQLCRTLLEARGSAFGSHHSSTLKASVLLINSILNRDLPEAMQAYRDTLGTYEVALGADDPETFELVSDFASNLAAHGARREAQRILEDALRTCESKYGPDSAAALEYVDDIAIFFANGGDTADAECYFKRAHQTRCQLLGASHEEALRSENNLAMFYDSEGMQEAAICAYRSVYTRRMEASGESNPKTIEAAHNLAAVLSALVRSSENREPQLVDDAVSLFKSALAGMEAQFGWTDDRTTNCAEKLAELHKAMDGFAEAEIYFRKVYDVQSSSPDKFARAQAASSAYNLANCLMQLERVSEAELLYSKAVSGYEDDSEDLNGASSLDRELYALDAMFNLAVCLQAQGKLDSASTFFKRAADGRVNLLGQEHVETARALTAWTQCTVACTAPDLSESVLVVADGRPDKSEKSANNQAVGSESSDRSRMSKKAKQRARKAALTRTMR